MILHRHIVISFIVFCNLAMFVLYLYSSNGTGRYSRQNEAALKLKTILSMIERDSSRYNKEIPLKLTEVIRLLSEDIADESNTGGLTNLFAWNSGEHSAQGEKAPLYACPEKFIHAKYGHPYFLTGSWITEDCGDVKPISKILTVVFVTSEGDPCSEADNQMILKVVKLYPDLPILIGAPEESECSAYKPNVKIVTFPSKTKLGSKLNGLIKNVKTSLTLIARNLDDFNWLARLERQLSVFSTEPNVVIVGGSVRNKTGHWQAGCYQTELKQYILKYVEGYYKSRHECMYCEHLIGPFIAQSRFLRLHEFDKSLQDDVVFEDFFLGIKQFNSGPILACPDVMYHSTDPGIQLKINKRETWLPLSAKWGLNRIVLPGGITHKFSCKESGLSCVTLYSRSGALMMPICCRDAMINGFKVFHDFCVKHNVLYQIEGGSTLGGVKLGDVIPWDLDGDGNYYADKKKLFAREMNWTNSDGEIYVDHLNDKGAGFFYVSTERAYIEFYAVPKLSVDVSNLSEIFRDTPTLIRIGDAWVYAPPSPGLYARNYYGNEILRHSNSYSHLGRPHWYSPYNVSDPFISCKIKHHACLDQFLTDGSIQFKIPDV